MLSTYSGNTSIFIMLIIFYCNIYIVIFSYIHTKSCSAIFNIHNINFIHVRSINSL